MTPVTDWLPAMACVNPWTADTFEMLYAIFKRDFKETQPVYAGCRVWFFPDLEDGKEVIFWHLTHRDDKITGQRLPDLRRSERLPWVRPLIDNSIEPEVLAWDYQESKGKINTYVWLKDYDFLTIMRKYRDGSRRLLTSYCIDFPRYPQKLRRKYEKRIK